MLGRKLAERLRSRPEIGGEPVTAVELFDIIPEPAVGPLETATVGDLADDAVAGDLISRRPDVVFHLAGVVSGEAEADFDKGDRVNLDGTRALFDAIRRSDLTPRVVFTSSIAVFGAPMPDVIGDDFHRTPLTSYGTQKLVGEALLADYSRRGFLDGVGVRLPTITVRPGAPNAAASGFFSGIIREPVNGREAVLPVPRSVRHPHASPRSAIGFLLHAAQLDSTALGARRNLTMPSVSATVGEQIDALRRIAGAEAADLIREVDDPAVATIVEGWPRAFDAARATSLGFTCESSFDEIIQAYIDDELEESLEDGDTASRRRSQDRLETDGVEVLGEVCSPAVVERLLEVAHRGARAARDALGSREIGIGSAAGFAEIVQRSPGRWDVPIDADEFGLDDREMPWWPLVESVLGDDAELWVSGVISSEPGSPEQYWHSDSPHESPEHRPANALNVLVALHDVPMAMGPTEFAPGSHRLTNHLANPSLVVEELIYQHATTSPETLVRGTSLAAPEAWARELAAGSCVVFDDRVLHRGMANDSDETRHVAYFTYRRPGYSTNTYFEAQRSVHDS